MRVVFFGTPAFAVPSLRALLDEGHDVAAVVSQPDRPRGRSRSTLLSPAVVQVARAHGLPVHQPDRPSGDLFLETLRRAQADLGVVAAYGHILRPSVLTLPPYGMLNVHASLLPRHRGAAPVTAAILAGDSVTGVSIMRMEAGLDTGPVLLHRATAISPQESAGELTGRLAELGAEAILEALDLLEQDEAVFEPQDEAAATYAPKVTREQARVNWQRDAVSVARAIRAFDPAPGAWTELEGDVVKLYRARAAEGHGAPGEFLPAGGDLLVAADDGAVAIGEVQPAGRRRVSGAEWLRGRQAGPGGRFA